MEEISSTPPDILEASKKAQQETIPKNEKTISKYQKIYNQYKSFLKEKNMNHTSPNSINAFIASLVEKNHKYSTLKSKHSILKSMLISQEQIPESFFQESFNYIQSFEATYAPEKAPTFKREDFENFLRKAGTSPEDTLRKLAFIFGVYGGLRLEDELTQITWNDVELDPQQNELHVRIAHSKTDQAGRGFFFTLIQENDPSIDPITIYKHYLTLVPEKLRTGRFFRYFNKGTIQNRPIGKSWFGELPKKIAQFLQLPNANEFSGHTLRRTGATFLANSEGITQLQLQLWGRWKSATVANGYIEKSTSTKRKLAEHIQNPSKIAKKDFKSDENPFFSFHNCSELNINFENCSFIASPEQKEKK